MPRACERLLDFDIDHYLNRFLPPYWLHRLPQPLPRFLGYRAEPPSRLPHLLVWAWSFIAALAGLTLIGGVFRISPWIQSLHPPGAAAILEFNCIESPLAQPRNVIIGQLLSATVGVSITKLFLYLPPELFQDLRWLIGPLNVGAASFLMGLTKTIHPPAGATALVAGTDPGAIAMGWSMIPLVLISDCLTLGSALLINNIQRRFPQYWWTAQDLSSDRAGPIESKEAAVNVGGLSGDTEQGAVECSQLEDLDHASHEIKVTDQSIEVPDWFILGDIESDLLRNLQSRLRRYDRSGRSGTHSQRPSPAGSGRHSSVRVDSPPAS